MDFRPSSLLFVLFCYCYPVPILLAQPQIDSLKAVLPEVIAGGKANEIVATHMNLGRAYSYHDFLAEALAQYELAQQLLPEVKDQPMLAPRLYHLIARVYRYQADYDLARQYYRRAIDAAPDEIPLDDLATYHSGLGFCFTVHDSAVYHHELAVGFAEQFGAPPQLMATVLENYGSEYVYRERYPEALKLMERAVEYARLSGDSMTYYTAAAHVGRIHQKNGNPSAALAPMRLAYRFIMRQPSMQNRLTISSALASAYAAAGQFDKAYRYELEASQLVDSLYQAQTATSLAEANVRFETVEREARLADQELEILRGKSSRTRLIFGALALLLLLAGTFQYFLQRNRLRRRELALEVEKREAEAAQLRELDGLKTRFFTNISHELRTPLTLITSPLEQAIGRLKQINLKPDLQLAHRNSQNLLTLVNEILDLGKLEAGQLAIRKATFSPDPLLRRFFHAFESLAAQRSVELHYTGDFPAVTQVTTDVRKLEKIVNNLLSNALKFSPEGGTITLQGSLDDERLAVAVTDSGPGIRPEDQQYIFDRYFQAEEGAREQGGTGIGLNLSRKLARLLGGDLTLDTTSAAGSTFRLTLPVDLSSGDQPEGLGVTTNPALMTSLAPAAAPPETTAWQPTGERPRILLVEDNVEMADYLFRHLSTHYEVTTAASGAAALAALSKEDFDLISSDVMMPGMDGFELRERVNEKAAWRKIPFLLLTARNLEEDKLRGFRLGIDDYVTKPFSLPEYQARINNLLQNRSERKASIATTPDSVVTPEEDLVARAETLVRSRLADTTFSVEEMARELGHGQRQLSRLLGAATGLTPVKFILELRLQRARQLLESGTYATVAEVRYEVGIESASYFTRKFTERFGKNPVKLLG